MIMNVNLRSFVNVCEWLRMIMNFHDSVGDQRTLGHDLISVAGQKFSTGSFSFGHDRTRVAIQKKIPVATLEKNPVATRIRSRPEFSTEATENFFFWKKCN